MFSQDKPYYSLDTYLKNTYGEKIYKVSLDPGFTCPNRDGTLSLGGCIFCSEGGSGDFASSTIEEGILRLNQKHTGTRYIAYFQAFTNTYAPIEVLREIYENALKHPSVVGISIATRPDCLAAEVLDLLDCLNHTYSDKFIWVELGLQTINEKTALYIRRGYKLSCFEEAVSNLHGIHIPVIVHMILGLPNDTKELYIKTMEYLNRLPVFGIKLQLLHVLKGTDLCLDYEKNPFPIYTMEEYCSLILELLMHLRPDMVIHRITGDGPKAQLVAPLWSSNKKMVLNYLHKQMKEQEFFQGKKYRKDLFL